MIYRVEDKYALPSDQMCILEGKIATILPKDAMTLEESYTVSSIYFDDIWDSNYEDSLNGNPERKKYRIRIYNNSFDSIKLEVKCKRYNKAFKHVSPLSFSEMDRLIKEAEIEENVDGSAARKLFYLALKNRAIRPRVIVTYDRSAYTCNEGNVRITFDRNLRASDRIELFGDKDLVYDYPFAESQILEIKYDEFLPRYLAGVLETGKMMLSSNSKYVLCYGIYKR